MRAPILSTTVVNYSLSSLDFEALKLRSSNLFKGMSCFHNTQPIEISTGFLPPVSGSPAASAPHSLNIVFSSPRACLLKRLSSTEWSLSSELHHGFFFFRFRYLHPLQISQHYAQSSNHYLYVKNSLFIIKNEYEYTKHCRCCIADTAAMSEENLYSCLWPTTVGEQTI